MRLTCAASMTDFVLLPLLATAALTTAAAAAVASVNNSGADWDLKLVDGYGSNEGTLLVRFGRAWGLVCDDGWNARAADVACRQMGFGRSLENSVLNKYRTKLDGRQIVLDDVRCSGRERRLSECRSRPLGQHDCRPSEAAGVRCSVVLGNGFDAAAGARPRWNPVDSVAGADAGLLRRLASPSYKLHVVNATLRRIGNATNATQPAGRSGAVLATVDGVLGALCPEHVTLREGTVLCRELGLGSASAVWAHPINDLVQQPSVSAAGLRPVLVVGNCRGGEKQILHCSLYGSGVRGVPCSVGNATVGVACTKDLPDLVPDSRVLQSSAYIVKMPMLYMSCAMEENCASAIAFEIRKNSPYWQYASRTLLRFTTMVYNLGTSDFLPLRPSAIWEWHTCHMHYHSMAYFAAYEVYQWHNSTHTTVAGGHKASFCLEDNACKPGQTPRYKCSQEQGDRGTQGITPGCSDNYLHDLDCQWVDITDIPYGQYRFRMVINPEYASGELSFDNNAVVCRMTYTSVEVRLYGCRLGHPFDF